jgi:hypothetical protein
VSDGTAASRARSLHAGTTLAVDVMTGTVVAELRRAGVAGLVLRGPAIGRWLYDEDVPRAYRDIDLLVDPGRAQQAHVVLESLGLVRRNAGFAPTEGVDHASEWKHEHQAVVVDLHRTLAGAAAAPGLVWQELTAGAREIEVEGAAVSVPGEPALALIVVLHAAHHGVAAAPQLADLRLALKRAPPATWVEAARIARRLDAVPAFAAGLRLLPEGAEVAERLRLPHTADPETLLRAAAAHSTAIGFARLASTRGLGAKLALVARKLVPTPAFMRHWSRLARRGRRGLLLAYLWRPVWLLLHLPTAALAWWRARSR